MSLRFCDNCELTAKVPGISDETSDGVKSFLEIVIRFARFGGSMLVWDHRVQLIAS